MALLRSVVALLSMAVLLEVVIYNWKTTDTGSNSFESYEAIKCFRLQQKFLKVTSAKKIKINLLIREVRELIVCPQNPNITQTEINRVKIRSCCNSTFNMLLTQQNTVMDQKVIYENQRRSSQTIDKDLFNMLPQSSPWANLSRRSCALVGSGGILKNSSCGQQIDNHDYVIRFNVPPVGPNYSGDVGKRTNMVTLNPSQISNGYMAVRKDTMPLAKHVSAYGNASILIHAFSDGTSSVIALAAHRGLRRLRPNQSVLFFNPDFLLDLHRFWRQMGLTSRRLSSGMMLVTTALEVCKELHLYGYWPFYVDLSEKPIPYHYYDQMKQEYMVHSMPQEFLYLLQLHSQGALQLHIGPCTN